MTSHAFEHLFDLERELHTFAVRSDRTQLMRLLSPDFFEFGASGTQWTLQDILHRLPTENGKTEIEARDFRALPLSEDVILVTYISKRICADGSAFEFLRSSIWKNNAGSWQMVFHQGTPAGSK